MYILTHKWDHKSHWLTTKHVLLTHVPEGCLSSIAVSPTLLKSYIQLTRLLIAGPVVISYCLHFSPCGRFRDGTEPNHKSTFKASVWMAVYLMSIHISLAQVSGMAKPKVMGNNYETFDKTSHLKARVKSKTNKYNRNTGTWKIQRQMKSTSQKTQDDLISLEILLILHSLNKDRTEHHQTKRKRIRARKLLEITIH